MEFLFGEKNALDAFALWLDFDAGQFRRRLLDDVALPIESPILMRAFHGDVDKKGKESASKAKEKVRKSQRAFRINYNMFMGKKKKAFVFDAGSD